ncbi:MAG: sulfatase [Phycisphaerales bacterium]
MRLLLAAGCVLCFFAFRPSYASDAPAERPNILFIMSDDHAAQAVSAYGSRVNETPNIDRIAHEGMIFRDMFVTNSICAPSRAAILTGQYSHVNGVTKFNRFDSARTTFPRLLQQNGYYCGMIGKWHLGSDPVGFDVWNILSGQGAYWSPTFYSATAQQTFTDKYVTDVITDLAIDFLDHRDRAKPFLLMVHHKAPHRPWEPDAAHAARFASLRIPEPVTFWDSYATRTDALHENRQRVADDLTNRDLKQAPPDGLAGEALARWKYQRYMQDYLACVQGVDDSVGRLLGYLDANGLAANTLVVYTSDQGFFLGEHGLYDKRFMYEESLRMPFVVRWPSAIAAHASSDAIALNVDIAPTFLELAGVPVPADVQGKSLVPILRGATPPDWRTAMYYRYYHDPGDHNTRAHYGIRTKTHKLIYFWKKDQWELFDLVNDPYELHNLYGQPGVEALTSTLKSELTRLKNEVGDDDRLAEQEFPRGVDGSVESLRGK